MISWTARGLHDSLGRFTNMANIGVSERVHAGAEELRAEIEGIYQDEAPRSSNEEEGHKHFADGLTAVVEFTLAGFSGAVRTDNPKLAKIIRFGHKAFAINAKFDAGGYTGVLHWQGGKYGEGDHFARYVFIPAHAGNDWESRANERVREAIAATGKHIADRIVMGL